jgi:hypothetical protein
MQSAKALQIKGLSGGNSEEKISEFATYLAQQQQQQQIQQQQQQQQLHQQQLHPYQQQQPSPQQQLLPQLPQPMASAPAPPFVATVPSRQKRGSPEEGRSSGKKRRARIPEVQGEMVTTYKFHEIGSLKKLSSQTCKARPRQDHLRKKYKNTQATYPPQGICR